MKRIHSLTGFKWTFLLSLISSTVMAEAPLPPTQELLPEQFKVYYNPDVGISRKAFKNSAEKIIPTNNEFEETPGCYLSCFSKTAHDAVYPIDTHMHLMGQVRVEGNYKNGLCFPKGLEGRDLRTAVELKTICENAFPERCENGKCWANGHTGHWW